jgi:RNA polymerase sigma-70 factor (ECF subfamily)
VPNRKAARNVNQIGLKVREPASLNSCSDEDLFGRASRGEQEAFAVLVRRYERELFGYLRRYIGDPTLADDAFQNTMLQLFLKREMYEPGRRFRPWLYAIATNQAIDLMRRRGRRAAVSLDQQTAEDAEGDVHRLVEMLEARSPAPLESASTEELRAMVRTAVDQLPEFLRQVVILAYFQGLPYRDVAESLDIPVGTVKSRLNAALHRLHDSWSGCPSVSET